MFNFHFGTAAPKPKIIPIETESFHTDITRFPNVLAKSSHPTNTKGVTKWPTLGDSHGNALKLLHFLCVEGIVTTPDANYQKAVITYEQCVTYESHVDKANAFKSDVLPHIQVKRGANARLLGDTMADYGANDALTLRLLEKLVDGGVNLEIILSNHDAYFICWMESKIKNQGLTGLPMKAMGGNQSISLIRLADMFDSGKITFEELTMLYDKYKKSLKVLSYDYTETGQLYLYSHAHLKEEDVFLMAKGIYELYKDKLSPSLQKELGALCDDIDKYPRNMITIEGTKRLVDLINKAAREFLDNNSLATIIDHEEDYLTRNHTDGHLINPLTKPFYFALWNRDDLDKLYSYDRPKNQHIVNVHGHHTYENGQKLAVGLNNTLGQFKYGRRNNAGQLSYVLSYSQNALQIRYDQLVALLMYLHTTGNISIKTDSETNCRYVEVTGTRPEVNQVCFLLKEYFNGRPVLENPVDRFDQMTKIWKHIDELLSDKAPSPLSQLKEKIKGMVGANSSDNRVTIADAKKQWNEGTVQKEISNSNNQGM